MDKEQLQTQKKPVFLAVKNSVIFAPGKGYTLFFGIDSNNPNDIVTPISAAEKLAVKAGGHLGIIGSHDQKTKIPLFHGHEHSFAITTSAPSLEDLQKRYPNAAIKLMGTLRELGHEYFNLRHPPSTLPQSKADYIENSQISSLREELIRRKGAWEHTSATNLFRLTIHGIPNSIDITDKFLKMINKECKRQDYTRTHADQAYTTHSPNINDPEKKDIHLFVSTKIYENVIQQMEPLERTSPDSLLQTFSHIFGNGILSGRPR